MAGTGVLRFIYDIAKVAWNVVTYPVYLLIGDTKVPIKLHIKCRNGSYPRDDNIKRFPVPDDAVSWSITPPCYNPVNYTAPVVLSKPVWADPDFRSEAGDVKWNSLDGKIDRRSHNGTYDVKDKVPRNPAGRTGITGRGLLGRWGPNHAADPVVTRWRRDENGAIVNDVTSEKPVLQFVAIERKDSGEWAIPGGMVDPGEAVSATLKREFGEEALNLLEASEEEKSALEEGINQLFSHGEEVYRGYVDDPRNTDNAWMETVALNFHDEDGTTVGKIKLHAGDDASNVRWQDLNGSLKLYASHIDFLETVARRRGAHW